MIDTQTDIDLLSSNHQIDHVEPLILIRSKFISAGNNLLLELPSGQIKPIRNLAPNTSISLGKFGKFQTNELINQPFGLTYEISEDGKLLPTSRDRFNYFENLLDNDNDNLNFLSNGNVDEIEATNENIKESNGAQKMTAEEIEELKKSGLSGREIILRQIQQHSAFELKSEFSKAKYIRRKEKKFLKMFTCLDPTVHNVTQYLFENNHFSIRGLRPDTLSQILTLSNVRPGWCGIVIDDIGGLLVGAILTRLDGHGIVYVINDTDSPPDFHLIDHLNLDPKLLVPLKSLNWTQIEPDWTTPEIEQVLNHPLVASQPLSPNSNDCKRETGPDRFNEKTRAKLKKKFKRAQELMKIRQDFLGNQFEGLITCSEYEPESIVSKLADRLSGSSTVVLYSPYLVPLSNLQNSLRKSSNFIHVTISEPWLRRYQVLPGRTHPEMNGTQGGGFILSAIKVIS
ncbi:hypothetical protein O181_028637 [Austropuccinia psidii MF-1]|uniref:tRNA (adenine(58)-N(1))-methyltransferase non-catalytic subunit TRM6 n=1 Tax=Austropuccinia psidii MF-1 TaxID=1389203 RepID=A0A9Q3H2S5_9BASI|nr:hypothetical protein [Austropuccinia psidii MF-1]